MLNNNLILSNDTTMSPWIQEVLIGLDELELSSHERSQSTVFDTRIQAAIRRTDWKLLTGHPGYHLWVPNPQQDYELCKLSKIS